MKTLIVSVAVVSMLVANTYLAWHFGAKSVHCPPCIESKCPSEDVYINTSYGILHFEAGELSKPQAYVMNKDEYDELCKKIEQEILKQMGGAS